jgi:hypothetical protein
VKSANDGTEFFLQHTHPLSIPTAKESRALITPDYRIVRQESYGFGDYEYVLEFSNGRTGMVTINLSLFGRSMATLVVDEDPSDAGQAASEPCWKGAPTIAGAENALLAGMGCAYQVKDTLGAVEEAYSNLLGSQGWSRSHRSESSTGPFGGPFVDLQFTRGGEEIGIMLTFSDGENSTLVLLSRLYPPE